MGIKDVANEWYGFKSILAGENAFYCRACDILYLPTELENYYDENIQIILTHELSHIAMTSYTLSGYYLFRQYNHYFFTLKKIINNPELRNSKNIVNTLKEKKQIIKTYTESLRYVLEPKANDHAYYTYMVLFNRENQLPTLKDLKIERLLSDSYHKSLDPYYMFIQRLWRLKKQGKISKLKYTYMPNLPFFIAVMHWELNDIWDANKLFTKYHSFENIHNSPKMRLQEAIWILNELPDSFFINNNLEDIAKLIIESFNEDYSLWVDLLTRWFFELDYRKVFLISHLNRLMRGKEEYNLPLLSFKHNLSDWNLEYLMDVTLIFHHFPMFIILKNDKGDNYFQDTDNSIIDMRKKPPFIPMNKSTKSFILSLMFEATYLLSLGSLIEKNKLNTCPLDDVYGFKYSCQKCIFSFMCNRILSIH